MKIESPASVNDPQVTAPEPDSRTCPHCSKIFRGSTMVGFGSHRAMCKKSGSAASEGGPRSKQYNCCCKSVFPTRSTLREHQEMCGVFKFRLEEKTNRALYNDP